MLSLARPNILIWEIFLPQDPKYEMFIKPGHWVVLEVLVNGFGNQKWKSGFGLGRIGRLGWCRVCTGSTWVGLRPRGFVVAAQAM